MGGSDSPSDGRRGLLSTAVIAAGSFVIGETVGEIELADEGASTDEPTEEKTDENQDDDDDLLNIMNAKKVEEAEDETNKENDAPEPEKAAAPAPAWTTL